MDDLISRSAAIDAMSCINDTICEGQAIEALWDLPSVQPEQRWIPCDERLPEPDERVLVYTVAHEYHVWDAMPHRSESYAWEDEEGLCHSLYEVDLWMPLLEPYAERRNDE